MSTRIYSGPSARFIQIPPVYVHIYFIRVSYTRTETNARHERILLLPVIYGVLDPVRAHNIPTRTYAKRPMRFEPHTKKKKITSLHFFFFFFFYPLVIYGRARYRDQSFAFLLFYPFPAPALREKARTLRETRSRFRARPR